MFCHSGYFAYLCMSYLYITMRVRFLVLALVLLSALTHATAEVAVRYRAAFATGVMMRDGKVDPWLTPRPLLGGELGVEFLPTGRWHSLQQFNNASVGLSLTYLNLGNDLKLGQVVAPYAYLRVPFVRLPHFELGIRAGLGVAFCDKRYINTVADGQAYKSVQDANQSIGSVANIYLPEVLFVDFPIGRGWSIGASFGWYHVSNGSIIQPNSGYNMFLGEIAATYHPHADTYSAPAADPPDGLYAGKRWDVELSVSGGVRQAYYRDRLFFGVGSLTLAAHYRPWSIFKIGAGVDVFYDDYYRCVNVGATASDRRTYFQKTYLSESNALNCLRVGVSLQPEFVVGNFTAGFHFGVYLYDNLRNLEPKADVDANGGPLDLPIFYRYDMLRAGSAGYRDGWLYTRILLKYRCTKHLFVQLGLKAHLTKAEFVDAGIGVAF